MSSNGFIVQMSLTRNAVILSVFWGVLPMMGYDVWYGIVT